MLCDFQPSRARPIHNNNTLQLYPAPKEPINNRRNGIHSDNTRKSHKPSDRQGWLPTFAAINVGGSLRETVHKS